METKDNKKTDINYYIKLFIKIIIFVATIYYIYKYRETIRRYISLINRWLRFSSPLRNVNTRFRNWRDRGNQAVREELLREAELGQPNEEFQDLDLEIPQENREFLPGAFNAAALAAAAATLPDRKELNRIKREQEMERQRATSLAANREPRVPNWTGPIKERLYRERNEAYNEERDRRLIKDREDDEILLGLGIGTTIPELRKYIIDNGYMMPPSIKGVSERRNLVTNIINKTLIPRYQSSLFPRLAGGSRTPGTQYDTPPSLPENWVSNLALAQQSNRDQEFLPVDFGKIRKSKKNKRL